MDYASARTICWNNSRMIDILVVVALHWTTADSTVEAQYWKKCNTRRNNKTKRSTVRCNDDDNRSTDRIGFGIYWKVNTETEKKWVSEAWKKAKQKTATQTNVEGNSVQFNWINWIKYKMVMWKTAMNWFKRWNQSTNCVGWLVMENSCWFNSSERRNLVFPV